jgi:hypothetical protein
VAGKGSIEASAITPSKNQVISSSFDQVVGGGGGGSESMADCW